MQEVDMGEPIFCDQCGAYIAKVWYPLPVVALCEKCEEERIEGR